MGAGAGGKDVVHVPQGHPVSRLNLCCFRFNAVVTYNDPCYIASHSGTILRGTLRRLVDKLHGEQLAKVRRRGLYPGLETHSITS